MKINNREFDVQSYWENMRHPRRRTGEMVQTWSMRCLDREIRRIKHMEEAVGLSAMSTDTDLYEAKETDDEKQQTLLSRPPLPIYQFVECGLPGDSKLTREKRICDYLHAIGVDEETECPGVFLRGNENNNQTEDKYGPNGGVRMCSYCNTTHEKYVVFDTETSGLGKKDQVIEIGYCVFDKNWKLMHSCEELWNAPVNINPGAQAVHGISQRDIRMYGIPPREGLLKFYKICKRVKQNGGLVIAHNVKFDKRMVEQTAVSAGLPMLCPSQVSFFCTYNALKPYRHTLGGSLKNENVFNVLGGNKSALGGGQAHRALYDCKMTAFIFKKGIDRGWWHSR